jgi:uncharacterized protein YaaQ
MDDAVPTKLVLAIVQVRDVQRLVHRLVAEGFGATRIDTYGGFLRKENAVVLVATTEDRLPLLSRVVNETCQRRMVTLLPPANDGTIGFYAPPRPEQVEVGGAVVLTLPIERVELLNRPAPSALAAAG